MAKRPTKPRVFLRHPVEADRDEYVALRRASREFLEPWDSTPPGQTKGANYAPEAFDRALASSKLETSMRFLVVHAESGAILGAIGISNICRGAFQSCTIGYWLGSEHAGRGYMTEGLAICLHFIFREMKLHRAEANIIPANAPSTALVRRLGFRDEGLGKRYIRINYRWQDHRRWAMTAEDFRTLCKRGTVPFSASVALRSVLTSQLGR
ncbi:MAG: GNAT family N-acetyltransferase [Planctomycetes bacterium]|nr:GNAT family N-acetyltransferase [Planctomycetota bacterium]